MKKSYKMFIKNNFLTVQKYNPTYEKCLKMEKEGKCYPNVSNVNYKEGCATENHCEGCMQPFEVRNAKPNYSINVGIWLRFGYWDIQIGI